MCFRASGRRSCTHVYAKKWMAEVISGAVIVTVHLPYSHTTPRSDKAMIIDGNTGRILADKYEIKGIQGEAASAVVAQKGFFVLQFSKDIFLLDGHRDGHLEAFPGTSAYVSVAIKNQLHAQA